MTEKKMKAKVQRVPGITSAGPPSGRNPIYVGTVGDPLGVEITVFGSPVEWFIYGIRGFGEAFVGSHGHRLTQESINLLNEAVEELEG